MINIDMENMGVATYCLDENGHLISSCPKMMFPGYYGMDLNLKTFFEHLREAWGIQLLNNDRVDAFKCSDHCTWQMPKALAKEPMYYFGEPIKENGRNYVLLKNGRVKLPLRHYDFVFDKQTGKPLFGKETDFFAQLESSIAHECGYTHRYPEINMKKMCRITEEDLDFSGAPDYIVPEGISYSFFRPASMASLMNGYQMLQDKLNDPMLSDEEALARYEERALLLGNTARPEKKIDLNAFYENNAEEIKDFSEEERKTYLRTLSDEIKNLKTVQADQHPADNIRGILARMIVFFEHQDEFPDLMDDAFFAAANSINENVNVWQKSIVPSRRNNVYENIFLSLTMVKNEGFALIKESEDYIDMKGFVEGDISAGKGIGEAKPGLKNKDTFLPMQVKLILQSALNETYLDGSIFISTDTVSKQMAALLKDTWENPDLTTMQPVTDGVAKIMGDYIIEMGFFPEKMLYKYLDKDVLRFYKEHLSDYFEETMDKGKECIDVVAIPAEPLRLTHHERHNPLVGDKGPSHDR